MNSNNFLLKNHASLLKTSRPLLSWLTVLFFVLVVSACGGSSSENPDASGLPSPVADGIDDEHLIPGPAGSPAASDDAMEKLPRITVEQRQFADTNVLVRLRGSVQAAEGAEIVRTLWTQVSGPDVEIRRPKALNNYILTPDVNTPTLLEFRLTAQDSEGRVNSATVAIRVQPQPTFLQVIGTIVSTLDSEVLFKVRLTDPSLESLTLGYLTQERTALAGLDFVDVSGELVFEPGDTVKTVSVPLLPGEPFTDHKTFGLRVMFTENGTQKSATGITAILPADQLEVQQIAFVEPGPFDIDVDEAFTNPLDETLAPGSGLIIYESDDSSIATVDNNGQVIGIRPGTATIRAIKEADSRYDSASDTFQVKVLFPTLVDFHALVGATDAKVNFGPTVDYYQFVRSAEADCLIYTDCTNVVNSPLDGTTVVDSVVNLGSVGYYWLDNAGNHSNRLEVVGNSDGNAEPPARYGHHLIAFGQKLWLIGGIEEGLSELPVAFNDVWKSDGISWERKTDEIFPLAGGPASQAVAYGGQLWVVDPDTGDVYRSDDGVAWSRDSFLPAGFVDHKLIVFNDKLVLAGDTLIDSVAVFEVRTYTPETGWSNPVQPGNVTMQDAEIIAYNNQLWMIGNVSYFGANSSGVWWSNDEGVRWTQVTATKPTFGDRTGHELAVFKDRLWVLGGIHSGSNGTPTNEVWSTIDGTDWVGVKNVAFNPVESFQVEVFNNRMWLQGGKDSSLSFPTLASTWVTEDGDNWRRVYRGTISFEALR